MPATILTARAILPSARLLTKYIQSLAEVELRYTSEVKEVSGRVAIRYGNYAKLPLSVTDTNFNSRKGILFLRDKQKVASFARNELGLDAPDFRKGWPSAEDFPVLIRKNLFGFGGRDIVVCEGLEEFENQYNNLQYYWCRYIPTFSEVRAHIGIPSDKDRSPIFRFMVKKPRTPEIAERKIHIRHTDSYHFSRRFKPHKVYPKLCRQIESFAWKVFKKYPGARLYSLDVGVGYDKSAIIFEANTGSGLDNGTGRQYAEFLIREGVHDDKNF